MSNPPQATDSVMLGNDDENIQRETSSLPQFGGQQQVPRRLPCTHAQNLAVLQIQNRILTSQRQQQVEENRRLAAGGREPQRVQRQSDALDLHVESLREAHTHLASNSQEFVQSLNTTLVAPFQGDQRHWNTVLRACGEAIEDLQGRNNVQGSRLRSQHERNAVLEIQVRELEELRTQNTSMVTQVQTQRGRINRRDARIREHRTQNAALTAQVRNEQARNARLTLRIQELEEQLRASSRPDAPNVVTSPPQAEQDSRSQAANLPIRRFSLSESQEPVSRPVRAARGTRHTNVSSASRPVRAARGTRHTNVSSATNRAISDRRGSQRQRQLDRLNQLDLHHLSAYEVIEDNRQWMVVHLWREVHDPNGAHYLRPADRNN